MLFRGSIVQGSRLPGRQILEPGQQSTKAASYRSEPLVPSGRCKLRPCSYFMAYSGEVCGPPKTGIRACFSSTLYSMPKKLSGHVAEPSDHEQQQRGDQWVDDQWCKHRVVPSY